MATWKRLTRSGGEGSAIDVNMDLVIHLQRFKDFTKLHFSVRAEHEVYTLQVRETPDEIHKVKPLRSY